MDKCPMASVEIDCTLVKENTEFSLESVLGVSKSELTAAANYTYINPANTGDVNPIEGITVINLTGSNHSLTLTSDNQTSSSFVLIDTTGVTSNTTPSISISGNGDFMGIIWIIGSASIQGTTEIRGSIFVESGDAQTAILGNASITYDTGVID